MENIIAVFRGSPETPVKNALKELDEQFKIRSRVLSLQKFWDKAGADDPVLVIGKADEALISRVLKENNLAIPHLPESLAIHRCSINNGRNALVIAGGDDRGLMYGIYELADLIRCEGFGIFERDIHLEEQPEHRVRGVDRYITNHLDEEWFHSIEFWEGFLKKMARNRFNRFTLITGFDTAYMTPPYPYFVEVPGFEQVRVSNLNDAKRDGNLETLRSIAGLCEDNSIVFSLASWQQRPWTVNQEYSVENIPEDDAVFTRYCAEGLKTLLTKCPGIKALQFRVNYEAGVNKNSGANTNETHEHFWLAIIDAAASVDRPVKLDLRAKGLTDAMIRHALSRGLDISIPTKYWCEHAALPYHITKLRTEEMRSLKNENSSRRYSYGDMIKKPHWYDMIYRLWSYGSINLFLWGDPDYAARFSKSLHMGDGIGFEVNSPLAMKGGMEAYARDPWNIHKDPALRTYRWEDERYWAFYLVFGRYGYNSDTDRDVISREFKFRLGSEGDEILRAYECASKVMPLITTIHFPVHPSLHYWPELCSGAALFGKNNYDPHFKELDYASTLPSDEELFYSIAGYADDELAGTLKPRYSPLEMRDLLHQLARDTREHLAKAGCSEKSSGEKLAVWVDFSMLAFLADFHSWKTLAAYCLYLYNKPGDKDRLLRSYEAMQNARINWEELSALGSRYYHEDLEFNAGNGRARNKNWQIRLEKIDLDINDLEKLLEEAGELPAGNSPEKYRQNLSSNYYSMMEKSKLKLRSEVPAFWNKRENLVLNVVNESSEEAAQVFLNYRHTDQTAGEYIRVPMERSGSVYQAHIPGEYFLQGFDVIVYFSALDKKSRPFIFPGINNSEYPAPYFVINSGPEG